MNEHFYLGQQETRKVVVKRMVVWMNMKDESIKCC